MQPAPQSEIAEEVSSLDLSGDLELEAKSIISHKNDSSDGEDDAASQDSDNLRRMIAKRKQNI